MGADGGFTEAVDLSSNIIKWFIQGAVVMLHVLKMQIKLICFALLFGLCVYVLK